MKYQFTPGDARALAAAASEAIRLLNHATHSGDGCPALDYPADAYDLLGTLSRLAARLPQLLMQVSSFLQRQLQCDLLAIDGGEHRGDPFGAIGTASYQLEIHAIDAASRLATALDAAQQAIAFASYLGGLVDDER